MTRRIYLLFTRSDSLVSRAIHYVTKDTYTHVSVCTDDDLQEFYSFARRHSYLPLPAGYAKESIFSGFYLRREQMPCCLCMLEGIAEDAYEELQLRLQQMYEQRHMYKYDVLGLLMYRLPVTLERENHYFCSCFVSELLQDVLHLELSKASHQISPQDLRMELDLQVLYEGNMAKLRMLVEQGLELPIYSQPPSAEQKGWQYI